MSVEEIRQQVPPRLIDVSTDFFELNARVSLAGMEMGLTSLLYRQSDGKVMTLERTFEYLPSVELLEVQTDPSLLPCFQGQIPADQDTLDSF